MPVPFFIRGLARGHLGIRGIEPPFPLLGVFSRGGGRGSLPLLHLIFWGISQRRRAWSLKDPQVLHSGVRFHFYWILTPLSRSHLWVLSIPPNTSVASFTLSVTWRGLFLSIPCWMTLRALSNFSIFSFCSFRSWKTSFHPSAPEEASKSSFPIVLLPVSINLFTSASCVEDRIGIVGTRCTLEPKSYPSSLRPNLRLAGRSNTSSDTCVQYALPDQGPEGAGSWSRMGHHPR